MPGRDKIPQRNNPIMKFFEYSHLPVPLQDISAPFAGLAQFINLEIADSAEKSAGLRKLLEAKDCIVRASL